MAVKMSMLFFWFVKLNGLASRYHHLEETQCLHIHEVGYCMFLRNGGINLKSPHGVTTQKNIDMLSRYFRLDKLLAPMYVPQPSLVLCFKPELVE